MIGQWALWVFVTTAIAALATPAVAQTTVPYPTTPAEIRAKLDDSPLNRDVSEVSKVFDEMNARAKSSNVPASAPASRPDNHVTGFRAAVQAFLDAAVQFHAAVSTGQDLRKPAKIIQTQTNVFLKYAKWQGSQAPRPDTSELEKMKPQQRPEEMLFSMTRILSNLREVLEDDRSPTTSIKHWETLEAFEVEAHRLKWFSSHLP